MSEKSVNIIVTGAFGQLGSELRDLQYNYPQFNFVFKTSRELDITDTQQIEATFNNDNFDWCINCAAYTDVDKAESEKEKAFAINTQALKQLSEICEEKNCKLIHISTDFVFDGTAKNPYTEEDETNPLSIYGKSKLHGEPYVLDIWDNIVIRSSWLYSSYGNNFLKTMMRLGNERESINVVSDQKGTPTYAADLAKLILDIIATKPDLKGLYHYSNEGAASWYEFAYEIMALSEIDCDVSPINTEDYPTAAKRPHYSVLNKEKIKRNVPDVDIPHWKDSLKVCIEKIKNDK